MRDAVMGIGRALRMIVTAPWMAWALRQELLDALRRARRPRGGKR